MKRITKIAIVCALFLFVSVIGVTATTMRVPHGGNWVALTGATANADDSKADTLITYWTQGKVTASMYTMTVYVKRTDGTVLPSAQASSSVVNQLRTASFFTNTAVAPTPHYHELFAAMYMY